jgi:polyisoprenoid-binding protein YceI
LTISAQDPISKIPEYKVCAVKVKKAEAPEDQEVETMAKWFFEPGHTAAEFRARHMMVTWVRGHFKNIHGTLEYDPANPSASSVEATIDARGIWTGEPDRDAHLRSADFLDVEHCPTIAFKADEVEPVSEHEYMLTGDLTIRGVTQRITLNVRYLGQWQTPWWEDGVDKGPKTRAGFVATTTINRHDFGVSWNGTLDRGGLVVSNNVHITIDVEAIRE